MSGELLDAVIRLACPRLRPSPASPPPLQTITDLLDPSRANLQVRENLEGQYVSNLTAHEVYRGACCGVRMAGFRGGVPLCIQS